MVTAPSNGKNRAVHPLKPLSRKPRPPLYALEAHLSNMNISDMRNSSTSFPDDYAERVYAGVLGKITGVYLGRPFEGWTYDEIMTKLGVIENYVHKALGLPLIVTDDDISGTLTWIRALEDHDFDRELSSIQIAETWLNYIVENKTTIWWGGLGNSTEHTAYLRLKTGEQPPRSGSISRNGKVLAEQIGAQIFVDGWAMLYPGNPDLAVDMACKSARVSHDGEAVYAASVMAAMESLAFIEGDTNCLIETALTFIPKDCAIYRLIRDIQDWRIIESDWRVARSLLEENYGYSVYAGNCHVVPNHGLVILSLLYGEDSLHRSLMIANTCGWDTDCNSGNVGCLMGIKNGLSGFKGPPDLRGPVADEIYLSSADGGRAITDAVAETYHIVNTARSVTGRSQIHPKAGARFHFELPGSMQGFRVVSKKHPPYSVGLENVEGHSRLGNRSLAIHLDNASNGSKPCIATRTFIECPRDREYSESRGYHLLASPTLNPGQVVHVGLEGDFENRGAIECGLLVDVYGFQDRLNRARGPNCDLEPGEYKTLSWTLAQCELPGFPIARVGIEILKCPEGTNTVYVDYLTWDGVPKLVLGKATSRGSMWRHAWVNACDMYGHRWYPESYRLIQNRGTGLLIYGNHDWSDYELGSEVTMHMVGSGGIAARVQGLRRYYALLLCKDQKVRLVKVNHGTRTLAEAPFEWKFYTTYELRISVSGPRLRGYIDGKLVFDLYDSERPMLSGGVALVCEDGTMGAESVSVSPVESW